jgi:hypothetical protein
MSSLWTAPNFTFPTVAGANLRPASLTREVASEKLSPLRLMAASFYDDDPTNLDGGRGEPVPGGLQPNNSDQRRQ